MGLAKLTPQELRSSLFASGIAGRIAQQKLSINFPAGVRLFDNGNWANPDRHAIVVSSNRDAALLVGAAMVITRREVQAIDISVLLRAMTNNDIETLEPLRMAEVIVLLGFFSKDWGACPFTTREIREIEGFITESINRRNVTFIFQADSENIGWYSAGFMANLLAHSELVK